MYVIILPTIIKRAYKLPNPPPPPPPTHTQSPFGGEDEDELFDSICNSRIPYSRYLDSYTIDFLDKLLQREPTQRLGCMEDRQPIRKHGFFRSIDFSRLEKREITPPYKPVVVRKDRWAVHIPYIIISTVQRSIFGCRKDDQLYM